MLWISCPLIQHPCSDSRNRTRLAVSSDVPSLPVGCRAASPVAHRIGHPAGVHRSWVDDVGAQVLSTELMRGGQHHPVQGRLGRSVGHIANRIAGQGDDAAAVRRQLLGECPQQQPATADVHGIVSVEAFHGRVQDGGIDALTVGEHQGVQWAEGGSSRADERARRDRFAKVGWEESDLGRRSELIGDVARIVRSVLQSEPFVVGAPAGEGEVPAVGSQSLSDSRGDAATSSHPGDQRGVSHRSIVAADDGGRERISMSTRC